MSEDLSVSQFDQIEEQDHQKKLALSLVVNLGFEGAIHTGLFNALYMR